MSHNTQVLSTDEAIEGDSARGPLVTMAAVAEAVGEQYGEPVVWTTARAGFALGGWSWAGQDARVAVVDHNVITARQALEVALWVGRGGEFDLDRLDG